MAEPSSRPEPELLEADGSRRGGAAPEAGRHYRLNTPAGVLDIWVMRTHSDGTVDIVCSCYGARWERRHLRMAGGDPPGKASAA